MTSPDSAPEHQILLRHCILKYLLPDVSQTSQSSHFTNGHFLIFPAQHVPPPLFLTWLNSFPTNLTFEAKSHRGILGTSASCTSHALLLSQPISCNPVPRHSAICLVLPLFLLVSPLSWAPSWPLLLQSIPNTRARDLVSKHRA